MADDMEGIYYSHQWRYYDFSANWDLFYAAWSTDQVQEVLAFDIQEWCRPTSWSSKALQWKKGDPLWHLSLEASDFWLDEIRMRVDDYPTSKDCRKESRYFGEGLNRGCNKQLRCKAAENRAFADVIFERMPSEFEPRHGTLESLILAGGGELLVDALYETAKLLVGEDSGLVKARDTTRENRMVVLLPEHDLKFDIYGYFFHVNDRDKDVRRYYAPDTHNTYEDHRLFFSESETDAYTTDDEDFDRESELCSSPVHTFSLDFHL
jgi:hypothetical protein